MGLGDFELELPGDSRTERRVWARFRLLVALTSAAVLSTTAILGWMYSDRRDLAVHVAEDEARDNHAKDDMRYVKDALDAIWTDVRDLEKAQCRANPKACPEGRR